MTLVVAVACSGGSKEVKRSGSGTGSGSARVAGTGSGSAHPAGTPAVIPDVGCLVTSCAYHAGANAYLTCLSGGAGVCFHFGGPCNPPDSCMFDAASKAYKQCASPVEGSCQQWGAACTPAKGCMYTPTDGLHRDKSGALCAP